MEKSKSKSNTTVIIGVIGLILMLVIFEVIRELWQKGRSPLSGNPLGYVIFVVVFVLVLAVGYLIHRRYKA